MSDSHPTASEVEEAVERCEKLLDRLYAEATAYEETQVFKDCAALRTLISAATQGARSEARPDPDPYGENPLHRHSPAPDVEGGMEPDRFGSWVPFRPAPSPQEGREAPQTQQADQLREERDRLRGAMRYMATAENWHGDPISTDAVLFGHDTPYELARSAPGDTVLDPFNGAGTTGLVALRHDRDYIGIELNAEYAQMARDRIYDDAPMLNQEAA